MSHAIAVWVGEQGEYPIPPAVAETVHRLNAGKRLSDRRTKGAKYLKLWGEIQDLQRAPVTYTPRQIVAMQKANPEPGEVVS